MATLRSCRAGTIFLAQVGQKAGKEAPFKGDLHYASLRMDSVDQSHCACGLCSWDGISRFPLAVAGYSFSGIPFRNVGSYRENDMTFFELQPIRIAKRKAGSLVILDSSPPPLHPLNDQRIMDDPLESRDGIIFFEEFSLSGGS